MKRILVGLVILIAVQAVFVAVWFAKRDRSTAATPSGGWGPSRVEIVREETVNLPFPDIELEHPDGSKAQLEPGQPTVVHLWGTWCAPCVEELPAILARAESSQTRFLAVAIDDDRDALRAFFDGEIPGVVRLPQGDDFAKRLGASILPQTLYVDDQNVVRRRWVGARAWTPDDWRGLTSR